MFKLPRLSLSRKPCRLCLDTKMEKVDLFDDGNYDEFSRLEIIIAIEKIFSFTITPTERINLICGKCLRLVKEFSEFFNLVVKTQTFLSNFTADYKESFIYRPPNIKHPDNFKELISVDVLKHENIEAFTIPMEIKEESLSHSQLKTDVDNLEEDNLNYATVDEKIEIKVEYPEENIDSFVKSDQLNVESVDNLFLKKDSDDINNHELLSISLNTSLPGEDVIKIQTESNQPAAVNTELEENERVDSDSRVMERNMEPVKLFENGTLIVTGNNLENVIRKFYNLQCQLCSHKPKFKYLYDLFQHYEEKHDTKGYITCCNTRYHTRTGVVHHMARHIQSDAFQCYICKKDLSTKAGLKTHLQTHLRTHLPEYGGIYKCNQCNKSYTKQSYLTKHLELHHRKRFRCTECSYVTCDVRLLAAHTKESNNDTTPHECKVCNKEFKLEACLITHLAQHTGEKIEGDSGTYPPKICVLPENHSSHRENPEVDTRDMRHIQKLNISTQQCFTGNLNNDENLLAVYNSKDTLDKEDDPIEHIESATKDIQDMIIEHSEITVDAVNIKQELQPLYLPKVVQISLRKFIHFPHNFICGVCYAVVGSRNDLENHKISECIKPRNVIQAGENKNICESTSYKDSQPDLLQIHKINHTSKKIYKCNVCLLKFTHLGIFKRHKTTHIGVKFNKCDICSFKCTNVSNFKRHQMRHTGEKLYQCDVCSFKCLRLDNLKIHKMSHTGIKPYQCNVCSHRYSTLSVLKKHKIIHTGEKPYQCDICSFKCTQSSHLKTHKMTHTGEKPYQCDVCSYKSSRISNLKKHKIKHTRHKKNISSYTKM